MQHNAEITITEQEARLLTGMVGECWHIQHDPQTPLCFKCLSYLPGIEANRTFLTPDDRQRVIEAIVEAGRWEEFWVFCGQRCDCMFRPHEFTRWLLIPPVRLCKLAAEWGETLEERWWK